MSRAVVRASVSQGATGGGPGSRVVRRLDRWMFDAYRTPTASLATYRIVYAGYLLLFIFTDFSWVGRFPASFHAAPPGPMRLFTAFPPGWVLVGLEVLLAVAAVALLVGYRTRAASLTVALTMFLGFGFVYSMGKINHGWLLFRLVPLCLAFTSWGERYSLDALRRRRGAAGDTGDGDEQADDGWPLALLASLTALALLTAAVPKVLGGWLDPSTHAVRSFIVRNVTLHGREPLLAEQVLRVDSSVFWSAMDLATIAIEGGLVLALLSPLAFRIGLALLVLFHAGVYLTMGITFAIAVVAYAAFVDWRPVARRVERGLPPARELAMRLRRCRARERSPVEGTRPRRVAALAGSPVGTASLVVLAGIGYHLVWSASGPPVAYAWSQLLGVGPKAAGQVTLVVGPVLAVVSLVGLVRRLRSR